MPSDTVALGAHSRRDARLARRASGIGSYGARSRSSAAGRRFLPQVMTGRPSAFAGRDGLLVGHAVERGPARRGGGSRAQCMGRACRRNARRAFAARYPTVDAGACPKASGEASLPRCLGGAGGHGTRNPQGRGANRGRGRARGNSRLCRPSAGIDRACAGRSRTDGVACCHATFAASCRYAAACSPHSRRLLRRPPRCPSTSQRRRNRLLPRLPPTSRRSPPASRRSQKRLQPERCRGEPNAAGARVKPEPVTAPVPPAAAPPLIEPSETGTGA